MKYCFYLFSFLVITSCVTVDSGTQNNTPRSDYLKTYPIYPTYDPDADNVYSDFDKERTAPFNKYRYTKYPRYNPEEDNPYYPPSTYAPHKIDHPNQYKYPKFNPEADNPILPDVTEYPMYWD